MKPIPGYLGYFAAEDGSIHSRRRDIHKKLKGEPRKEDGRLRYTLRRDNGTFDRKYGSYFVLLTWTGERPRGMEACHDDGNCLNDAPSNLRWDTSSANKNDMKKHGTAPVGEQSPTAKLTVPEVQNIRKLRSRGTPLRVLAGQYGVTEANISAICKRRTWKHV